MANAGAASLAALIPARAAASRRNGAKSRGPKTPEGKARSSRNALKHGLCAQHLVALGDEDLDAFDALEAALMAELAPQGVMQAMLVRRIVAAAWRLERAERMEAEVFAHNARDTASFGLALIRDCNRGRAFDTLLRYRGSTLAELWRSLRTLKELQAEGAALAAAHQDAAEHARGAQRNEPKPRTNAGDSRADADPSATSPAPGPVEARPEAVPVLGTAADAAARQEVAAPQEAARENTGDRQAEMPSKPKARRIPGESAALRGPAPTPALAASEPAPAPMAAPVADLASAPARPAAPQPPCGAPGGSAAPQRIEPKRRTSPGKTTPPPAPLFDPRRPAGPAGVAGTDSHGRMDHPNDTLMAKS